MRAVRAGLADGLVTPLQRYGFLREDFHAVIDGMQMDVDGDIVAPDAATLDLYCDRVASAVGRLSVRIFGLPEAEGVALAHHLGRALQLTNILRDIDEDAAIGRLYLPRENFLAAGITDPTPEKVVALPDLGPVCAPLMQQAKDHFDAAEAIMARQPRRKIRAPKIMSIAYAAIWRRLSERGFCAAKGKNQDAETGAASRRPDLRVFLMARVHIVGAGLAGLSAAVELCESAEIHLYEAAPQAGGRCRSYFDSTLNMTIDNGNHLLLSGNDSALAYAKKIGGAEKLAGPDEADFDFCDLERDKRWRLRPNAGPLPWWILAPDRRVPGTAGLDYLALVKLLFARRDQKLRPFLGTGDLARDLWDPLFVSALNTDPSEASAFLAGAIVRETFAKGGAACRPLVAVEGLSAAFVDPALAFLRAHGAQVRFGAKLRGMEFAGDRVAALDFDERENPCSPPMIGSYWR